MKFSWLDAEKNLVKTTITKKKEETFSLKDLAQEWVNRKVALATARADIVAFREKVAVLCTDLALDKTDLVDIDDLDTFKEVVK